MVGTHVLLTSISLAHDAFGIDVGLSSNGDGSSDRSRQGIDVDKTTKKNYMDHKDPVMTKSMTDFVTDLYSGNGVVPRQGLLLAKDVVFEASPVISMGEEEVVEIYRAFYLFLPYFLSPPKCIESEQDTTTGSVLWTFLLHQRYFGFLQDKSLLVVHARYAMGSPLEEENGGDHNLVANGIRVVEILKLEERWNGIKSLDTLLISLSRRINGTLSWYFTSSLVPDKSVFFSTKSG